MRNVSKFCWLKQTQFQLLLFQALEPETLFRKKYTAPRLQAKGKHCSAVAAPIHASAPTFGIFYSFFTARRFERAIRKRPNTVRCLAVKSTLLGTRHPRKEKEAALQNVIGEPACLCGDIKMCHSIGDGTKH